MIFRGIMRSILSILKYWLHRYIDTYIKQQLPVSLVSLFLSTPLHWFWPDTYSTHCSLALRAHWLMSSTSRIIYAASAEDTMICSLLLKDSRIPNCSTSVTWPFTISGSRQLGKGDIEMELFECNDTTIVLLWKRSSNFQYTNSKKCSKSHPADGRR